jgi:hypothetical protein
MNVTVSAIVKARVLKEDNYCCHYCGEYAQTVDHKEPVALGGNDGRDNLVAACQPCNTAKSDLPYDLYIRLARRFGRPGPGNRVSMRNRYVDRAVLKIALNDVGATKLCVIVLAKFADGDPEVALRMIRRGLTKGCLPFNVQEMRNLLLEQVGRTSDEDADILENQLMALDDDLDPSPRILVGCLSGKP